MKKNAVYSFVQNFLKDSKTVFEFVLACTVRDFYYIKREKITLYRRKNKSSENVIKVGVFPPLDPFSWALQLR